MSSISAFYRDKVVFVTGGTGFIGKIVVEKLLRTCEVKEVVLMVREKKNTQPEQRIKTLCSSPVSSKRFPISTSTASSSLVCPLGRRIRNIRSVM
uniref:Fatty acyl-CoA reductase n=1 Tax=Anopheles albimanus TaxID=7167 RepID=A0A182F865_ANOAL